MKDNIEMEEALKKLEEDVKTMNEFLDQLHNHTINIEEELAKIPTSEEKKQSFEEECTTFELGYIGPLMAEMITQIEGEEYIYHEAKYSQIIDCMERWGPSKDFYNYNGYLISQASEVKDSYTERLTYLDVPEFPFSKKIIPLKLSLYHGTDNEKTCLKDNLIASGINEDLLYILNFPDDIINYCYEHNKSKLEEEDLKIVISNFIKKNKETKSGDKPSRLRLILKELENYYM